jgi:hypothetical protein
MNKKYGGMTVNERLYISGLMSEFDQAVERKDVHAIRSILAQVELTETSIVNILKSLGIDV